MGDFEWSFKIFDEMSAPAKSGANELKKLESELKATERALKTLNHEQINQKIASEKNPIKAQSMQLKIVQSQLQDRLRAEKKALSEQKSAHEETKNMISGAATGLAIEVAAVAAVAGGFVALTKSIVETAIAETEMKREAIASLSALDMTADAAREQYDVIESMSLGTKQTVEEMVADFKNLKAQGLDSRAVEDVIAAASDVAVTQGEGARSALVEAISNIQATGQLTERGLKALKHVGAVNPKKLTAYIAEQHHTDVKTAEALIKQGSISSTEGINAILSLVQKNIDKGGALGETSALNAEQSATVQIKNLKKLYGDLFEDADTTGFAAGLKNIGSALDENSRSGALLKSVINATVKDVGDFFKEFLKGDRVQNYLIGIGNTFSTIEKSVKIFGDSFMASFSPALDQFTQFMSVGSGEPAMDTKKALQDIGAVAGLTAGAILTLAGGISQVAGAFVDVTTTIKKYEDMFADFGVNLVKGFITGITNGYEEVRNAVTGLAGSAVDALKSALKIHSPSLVMKELGVHTATGFSLGMDSERPDYTSLLPEKSDFSGASDRVGGGGGGGGGRSISVGDIHISIEGGSSSTSQPAQLAMEIAAQVRAEILRHLEGLAYEGA